MTGDSLNIQLEQLEKLKQLFPETVTEGKIDWEKLQVSLGKDNIEFNNERYVLNWAGKTEAFKVLQQSTSATLKPVPDESVNFDTSENIFIEGENLEVLKVLQKSYYGKIKVIIIDPPYNTGNDSFIYPDSFKESRAEYEKRIGDKDEDGYLMKEGFFRKNSRDSGHYHSNWLSMMYPRLFLAKNLLRDDGVIFVHIDDNEVHNLRMIMNEIFGEENFGSCFIWEKRTNRENRKMVSARHDYILCYIKNLSNPKGVLKPLPMSLEALSRYKNPDNDPRGNWKSDPATAQAGHGTKSQFYILEAPNGKKHNLQSGRCWLYTKEVMNEAIRDNRIWFGTNGNGVPRIKTFLDSKERGLTPESILFAEDASTNEDAKNYLKELFDGNAVFETPKPVELIEILLKLSTDDSIVLDFFAGTSATAEAVIKLNNGSKFIMVQLPELCSEDSVAFKLGYQTISDISKERIRRVIKEIEEDKIEKIQGNISLSVSIAEFRKEFEKRKLEKPELDFENIDVSSESKKILDKIEIIEKKIQQNDHLISKINTIDLGFKSFRLVSSNFKIWRGSEITEDNLEQQLAMFTDPVREGSENENMLYELMLKAGYLLTDKVTLVDNYYSINDGELIIALETMSQQLIDTMLAAKPKKVITLDKLFIDNDQLKTNAVLQMRDGEVDFKTV
ncbi:MAG: site-specific DNA-methyltransferase [Lentimicrobiaceae bacterium]|jgi:adenine-specific DNA-methyltransferase